VSKYDASGNLLWTKQFGTSADDHAFGISSDGLGNLYIAGATSGDFDGPNAGESDAFVAKIRDIPEPATIAWGGVCSAAVMAFGRKRRPASNRPA
jgi:hypothetical protein